MAQNEKRPLFREKSLEKIQSPEQLNTYIKVSNAGVWMMMCAMILFLVGALVWGILGRIATYGPAIARVENKEVTVYLPYKELENQQVPSTLRFEIGDARFSIDLPEGVEPSEITDGDINRMDSLTAYKGNFQSGDWIYQFSGPIDYPDGVYDCRVITREYAPISFITN
ncbi:MAG: hypothetical protein J5518_03530 [Lachnospiraceae bacterium]|nr:hypothetical protein [Lachnospiraceae bacterium]